MKAERRDMNRPSRITLRTVEPSDLDAFHAYSLDPASIRMAAFVGANRTDRAVFGAHWAKILADSRNTNRTIVADGHVAGYIGCFLQDGNLEVTYWLGREFWGRGLVTEALRQMLQLITARPIFARAATDNLGSLHVLQKCGFKITGRDKGFALGRGEETEESILRLD
jgi:RimJ/RimL family protein N-acetyltransferase